MSVPLYKVFWLWVQSVTSPSETSELLCAFPSGKAEQAIYGEKINPIILGSYNSLFFLNSSDAFDHMITTAHTPVIHINIFCDQNANNRCTLDMATLAIYHLLYKTQTSKYLQIFAIQLTFLQLASMLFLAEDFCL